MLNCDKMDKILNDLSISSDNIKELSETQIKFETALDTLSKTLIEITNEKKSVEQLASSVESIEKTHNAIDEKINNILQDYKKVHSSFEYTELELKKNSSLLNSLHNKTQEKMDVLHNEMQDNINSIRKELAETKQQNKGLKSTIFVGIGISIAIFIMCFINLFI